MPELKTPNFKKRAEPEKKTGGKQQDNKTHSAGIPTGALDVVSLKSTPYLPRENRYNQLLNYSGSERQRQNLFLSLQRSYGNHYVNHLVNTTLMKANKPPTGKPPQSSGTPLEKNLTMVIEATYIYKPGKNGKSPAKSLFSRNTLGDQLKPGDAVELLDTKYPENTPEWQLAKIPGKDLTGFIRLSKIMPRGFSFSAEQKSKIKTEGVNNLPENLDQIKGITGSLGDLFGTGSGANDQVFEQAAYVLLSEDRELAWKLRIKAFSDDDKEKYQKSVESYVPWLKTALGAQETRFASSGIGIAGAGAEAISGIIGMAQGIIKVFDSKSEMNDKVEGAISLGGGGIGLLSGLASMGSSASGIITKATGKESTSGKIADVVGTIIKPLGDGLKTLKSLVETIGIILKAFFSLFKWMVKGVKPKLSDFLSGLADFINSVLGTLKGAISTAAGILGWLKMLPGVTVIFGLVGSAIDLVSGIIEFFKTTFETVTLGREIKENKDNVAKLENEKKQAENGLPEKLKRLSKAAGYNLNISGSGQIPVSQIEEVLNKYANSPAKNKSKSTEQDFRDVRNYLVDQNLEETVQKRINRGYSKVPEFVMSLTGTGISIGGGLVSVIADVVGIIGAPTGIVLGIATAVKSIASLSTGIISGLLKFGKTVYSLGRSAVRSIKQFGRNKGWWGDKTKTTSQKLEKRKKQTLMIMGMVFDLPPYQKSGPSVVKEYNLAQFRLKATNMDQEELFKLNGKPLEQAKEVFKALGKRE